MCDTPSATGLLGIGKILPGSSNTSKEESINFVVNAASSLHINCVADETRSKSAESNTDPSCTGLESNRDKVPSDYSSRNCVKDRCNVCVASESTVNMCAPRVIILVSNVNTYPSKTKYPDSVTTDELL